MTNSKSVQTRDLAANPAGEGNPDEPELVNMADLDRPDYGGLRKHLIVEGWRSLAQTFSLVNQWQLLQLARRPDLDLKVIDAPVPGGRWEALDGLFDPRSQRKLNAIPTAAPGASADVTLRMTFPLDFSPSPSRSTIVFGTSPRQVLPREQFSDPRVHERASPIAENIKIVTPSRWAAEGFYKFGFRPEQVFIVPHGVDTDTFRVLPEQRQNIRKQLGSPDSDFVFLSVGAMTPDKGIDLLLKAFAAVSRRHPQARLVLKGLDKFHESSTWLDKQLGDLPAADRERISRRMTYFGDAYSNKKMASLYQVADAYVSPYRSGGFNLPVLEAAACGLPIICTGGGTTDEVVTDVFARRIDSTKLTVDQDGSRLEPDLNHLVALMCGLIEDHAWRRQAARIAPLFVGANFKWGRAADRLVERIFV